MKLSSILNTEIGKYGNPCVEIKHPLGLLPDRDAWTSFRNDVASVRYIVKDEHGCYIEYAGDKFYFDKIDPGLAIGTTIKKCPNIEYFKDDLSVGALYVMIRHIQSTNSWPDISLNKIERILRHFIHKRLKEQEMMEGDHDL